MTISALSTLAIVVKMFTKLLVFFWAFAVLSIATESSADTIEVIEIDPRTFNQQHQNQQCQQHANYYDKYYNSYYNNYYSNYYNKYWNDYYYKYFKQHYEQQNQVQIPNVNIGNAKVEWVCTNPKTKDQMIIGSEQVPTNGHYYPQPNYPNAQQPHYHPQQPQYPSHQQPNYQPQQPHYPPPQQQPNYPPAKPSFPTDPNPQPNPNNNNNQQHQPAQTDKPNTNGEGLIDIRFGDDDE